MRSKSGHENELNADNPERCTANELQSGSQFGQRFRRLGACPLDLILFKDEQQGRRSFEEQISLS